MTAIAHIMGLLQVPLLVLLTITSLALIFTVMSQTTKSEGLTSGSIGGQLTPSFKGKPGMEEQVRAWTIRISVAWFALGILAAIAYTAGK